MVKLNKLVLCLCLGFQCMHVCVCVCVRACVRACLRCVRVHGLVRVHLQTFFCSQGRIKYKLIGDFPAPYFFKIDENSGIITIRKSLKADKATNYTVSYTNL